MIGTSSKFWSPLCRTSLWCKGMQERLKGHFATCVLQCLRRMRQLELALWIVDMTAKVQT